MPNFTTKDLLIATTLIAVGVAMTCFTFHWLAAAARASTAPPSILPQFACWFLGPALIGAGTLFPFKRPALGAVAALLLEAVVLYALLVH